jgi:hypothetical protein
MPFDINYQYGVSTQEVTHASVPPKGRKVESADFIIMYINGIAIGLIQRFAPRETRDVMPQYELGNIYPVEFVPSVWTGSIDVTRLEIFKDSLMDAFQFNASLAQNTYDLAEYWPSNKWGPSQGSTNSGGAGTVGPIVTTIADIQWPIDIQVHTTNPAPEVNQITIQTFEECWITGYGTSYDAGAKTVAENVTFTFRNKTITVADIVVGASNTNSVLGDFSTLVTNPV